MEQLRSGNRESFWEQTLPYFINCQVGIQYRHLPIPQKHILSRAKSMRPDIIHLHNIHGGDLGFFQISLLQKLSQFAPVVWTLHDMWSLTGHCAYPLSCERWKVACGKCPHLDFYPKLQRDGTRLNRRYKHRIIEKSGVHAVSPSEWLAKVNVEAGTFRKERMHHIPNGVDLEIFQPAKDSKYKVNLGIRKDAVVLLFAAERVDGNPRKGGALLIELVERLVKSSPVKIDLLVLGKGGLGVDFESTIVRVIEVGYVDDHRIVARYMGLSDIFIFTSIQDNLPNTLLEAHASGLAVVAFDVGGVPEIVINKHTGLLCRKGDVQQMSKSIISLCQNQGILERYKKEARTHVEENYSIHKMKESYKLLYKKLSVEPPK